MSLLILGYIAAVVSLAGIILNAKKMMACWPVWLVSNVMWITYSGIEGNIPSIVLWITFSIFNVYGWIQWRKDVKKKNEEETMKKEEKNLFTRIMLQHRD